MGFNKQNYIKIREIYETKAKNAQANADALCLSLYSKLPSLREIDNELHKTGVKVMGEAMKGKQGLEDRIAALEKENKALLAKREKILTDAGYPEDYTDVKYECNKCRDSGFVNGIMCDCFKKALVKAGFESSGLGALLKDQSFETFDINRYPENKSEMQFVFQKCLSYADSFDGKGQNLLLIGGTGLGKTHLSTSIGKAVIEKGYDVVYESIQKILDDFEAEKFRNAENLTNKYMNCDLLIVDDLGTEMSTQFTLSAIFNLINTRLISGKSTVINTNLTDSELRKRYTDRISSRLFGSYSPLLFKGRDVRLQKLLEK